MKRWLWLAAALVACTPARSVFLAVELDGKPDFGPVTAVIDAARPRWTACLNTKTRSSTALTFNLDAGGHAKMPFLDHPFPQVACLRDTLAALAYPPGAARVVTVLIVHATKKESALSHILDKEQ